MFLTDATNLPRLMQCNGSRLMEHAGRIDNEENDTTIRDEGNAAHYMARAVFNHEFNIEELIERKAPNGVYMTPEMAEHVAAYLDIVQHRHYEQSSSVETDTSFGTDFWRINGRADFIGHSIYEQDSTVYVDDFKYGWRIVEPQDNWTLIWHAIGYCITRQITPCNIELTIHQPRPYHPDGKVRTAILSYTELWNRYLQIAMTMEKPSDLLNTGPYCGRCPALATCPAARLARMNSIDIANHLAFNDDIDNAQLSFDVDQMKRAISFLESHLKASEELIIHRLQSGQVIDNYSLEMGFSNTQWKEGVTADMLQILTGQNLTTGKLLTPGQAKKKGIPAAIVDSLSGRIPTGKKLVRIDANKKAKRLLGDKNNED